MGRSVEQVGKILGDRLAEFWTSAATRPRYISCVVYATSRDHLANRRPGELVVLEGGAYTHECTTQMLDGSESPLT